MTLTRVPPEVRNVVDTWVHNESACTTPLDVSIEAVADGYVVNARDARGGLRVRIVPDAQTIGVLIASWSADDRIPPPGIESGEAESAPGMAVPSERAGAVRDAAHDRRVLVSGLAGRATGIRGEVDLLGGVIPIGVAAGGQTVGEAFKFHATLYGGVDLPIQRCHLRAQIGGGARIGEGVNGAGTPAFDLVAEASLTASVELGAGWGVTAGALATQTFLIFNNSPYITLPITPMALLGVSRRL